MEEDTTIECIMCRNQTPTGFLKKHISFHHMTQDEDIVEKLYKMHFPSKEIECQTSLSWVSEMVQLEERLEEIEDSLETEQSQQPAPQSEKSAFGFGVIVNETDMTEEEFTEKRTRLRGPRSIRRKRGEPLSSDEEEEENIPEDIHERLQELGLLPESALTRFRCQYCNFSHVDRSTTDHHTVFVHSIPSTSRANPKYKKAKKQKMYVNISKTDKVPDKLIEELENCEDSLPEEEMDNCNSECLSSYEDDNHYQVESQEECDSSELQDDWSNCDATLPEGWQYSSSRKMYRSPYGEEMDSRDQIVAYMLGKGIEVYHPSGYTGVTPDYIDCDGYCEGACDYFRIFKRFFHEEDKNKRRKSTIINFVEDNHTKSIDDKLLKLSARPDNDIKVTTYYPAFVKGERPWILCEKGPQDQEVERKENSKPQVQAIHKLKPSKKRKRSSSVDNSSSSRDSTPSRSSKRKQTHKNSTKEEVEYEGIYVQCCKKSCGTWRLVTQYKEADCVPDYWVCSMNRDRSNNVCGVGGNAFTADTDNMDIKFSLGSLVWAKLKGFPWWPGMIDMCPDSDEFFWVDENISETEPAWYNVVYFEGKGTEVTRAWIRVTDIVSMTTPIKQPHGKTASRPGPLRNRLLNAVNMAEEAKNLSRKDRLKEFSFEALFEDKKGKASKKRIRISPSPQPTKRIRGPSIEKTREPKEEPRFKPKFQPCQPHSVVKKKFVKSSFLAPNFSDDSDESEDERIMVRKLEKPRHLIRKQPVQHEKEENDGDESSEDNDENEEKKASSDEDDLLGQIMKKYSKDDERTTPRKTDILDDLESTSSQSDEAQNNEASLEETLLEDSAMVSLVIKEEKSDSLDPVIESVSSQSTTEVFIKPEELVSTYNPNLEKTFKKPSLPVDLLIALSIKNIDPNQEVGASLDEIVSFICLMFPYYNKNFEECKDLVTSIHDTLLQKKQEKFYLQPSLESSLLNRLKRIIELNEKQITDSLLLGQFLQPLMDKIENGLKSEAVNFRPPYSCKMLSYLAFISLCPPISITQVILFLKFLFPSLITNNTFEEEDFEEWIKNDEHVQELITAEGARLYLLCEGVYPTVLHQVRQFFATKSNFTRLKKSIYDIKFIDYLLPNLDQPL